MCLNTAGLEAIIVDFNHTPCFFFFFFFVASALGLH